MLRILQFRLCAPVSTLNEENALDRPKRVQPVNNAGAKSVPTQGAGDSRWP